MFKKTTLKEICENLLTDKIKLTDNTVCGECSKCGECCTCFLPICQEELNTIQDYIMTNNIKPQTHMIVMQNRLTCPYYDGKKCLIYEARPLICKEFYCNKKITAQEATKFGDKEYMCVNMWAIAIEIEKQRKKLKRGS